MKERERIADLFKNLYDGEPWIDVNIVNTLKNISASKAAHKPASANSIWQIVNHMVLWRKNVLERVQGESPKKPGDNYISNIDDTSDNAWKKILLEFEQTQTDWLNFLATFNESNFEKIYPPNNMNYYEHIHGIIQHDAYHLGQIILLAKG
jgi:uncharacterized damage-inducible protein DinB